MAKNFPFFKFFPTEWMTGDIVFETLSCQGLFINICALYWQRDGKLTCDEVNKRYKNPPELDQIYSFLNVTDGNINIKFLDEQLTDVGHISKKNSENGKKGAEAKRNKATAKRPLSEGSANLSKEEKELELEKEEEKELYKECLPKNYDEAIELLKSSQIWIESICMLHQIDFNSVSKALDMFKPHRMATGKEFDNLDDFKIHFNNWLRKVDKSQFKTKTNKKEIL